MNKVYFRSCGGLYLIGKVRKHYNIGDILRLKSFKSKVQIVEIKQYNNNNDIIVITNIIKII